MSLTAGQSEHQQAGSSYAGERVSQQPPLICPPPTLLQDSAARGLAAPCPAAAASVTAKRSPWSVRTRSPRPGALPPARPNGGPRGGGPSRRRPRRRDADNRRGAPDRRRRRSRVPPAPVGLRPGNGEIHAAGAPRAGDPHGPRPRRIDGGGSGPHHPDAPAAEIEAGGRGRPRDTPRGPPARKGRNRRPDRDSTGAMATPGP